MSKTSKGKGVTRLKSVIKDETAWIYELDDGMILETGINTVIGQYKAVAKKLYQRKVDEGSTWSWSWKETPQYPSDHNLQFVEKVIGMLDMLSCIFKGSDNVYTVERKYRFNQTSCMNVFFLHKGIPMEECIAHISENDRDTGLYMYPAVNDGRFSFMPCGGGVRLEVEIKDMIKIVSLEALKAMERVHKECPR